MKKLLILFGLISSSLFCSYTINVGEHNRKKITINKGDTIAFRTYYGGPYYPKNCWQLFKDFDPKVITLEKVDKKETFLKSMWPEYWFIPFIEKTYFFKANKPGITNLAFVEKTKVINDTCTSLATAIYTIEVK